MQDFDPALNAIIPAPLPEDDFYFIEAADMDPEHTVTIRTNGGTPRYVAVTEPQPVSEILRQAGLTWNGSLDIFTEAGQIPVDSPVNGGQTVTILGNVKGG